MAVPCFCTVAMFALRSRSYCFALLRGCQRYRIFYGKQFFLTEIK